MGEGEGGGDYNFDFTLPLSPPIKGGGIFEGHANTVRHKMCLAITIKHFNAII